MRLIFERATPERCLVKYCAEPSLNTSVHPQQQQAQQPQEPKQQESSTARLEAQKEEVKPAAVDTIYPQQCVPVSSSR